ncbi:MAG: hypothetical protein PUP92_11745 [Rhizonema sp. PD38]|nr:hypothetical protein [Rhizonema sp. PD38]
MFAIAIASPIAQGSEKQLRANYHTRLSRRYKFIALLLVSLIVVACSQNPKTTLSPVDNSPTKSQVLRIWWDKGFTLE